MRLVLLVLLLANLAFFAWARWLAPERGDTAISAPLSAPRIVLAGERPALSAAAHGVARCVSVGPFATAGQASEAAKALGQNALGVRERGELASVTDGYWVYAGGFDSAVEVMEALQRLRRNGFADAEAMPPSPEGRRISAGVFGERERAESVAARMQRLGLQPVVAARTREEQTFWVDLDLAPTAAEPGPEVLQSGAPPGTTLQVKACHAVPDAAPPPVEAGGEAAAADTAPIA